MPALLNNVSYRFKLNSTDYNAYVNGHVLFDDAVENDEYIRESTVDRIWDINTNEYVNAVVFTITPTPNDSIVTLSADGYETVTGVGKQSITVANNTNVTVNITKTDWTTYNQVTNVSISDFTYGNLVHNYISLSKELRLLATYNAGTEEALTYQLDGSLYNYVQIKIAGAAGQQVLKSKEDNITWLGTPGRGAILQISSYFTGNPTIQFILGKQPVKEVGSSNKGGWGYYSGGISGYSINPNDATTFIYGGGGGGSSAVTFDQVYQACGGGGVGTFSGTPEVISEYDNVAYDVSSVTVQGAEGGGITGGQATPTDGSLTGIINGFDATDANLIGYNDGNGYIQIYVAYYPRD